MEIVFAVDLLDLDRCGFAIQYSADGIKYQMTLDPTPPSVPAA